jgi:hypothetical protein
VTVSCLAAGQAAGGRSFIQIRRLSSSSFISECNGTAGACTSPAQIDIARSYDRAGNVTSETQNLFASVADHRNSSGSISETPQLTSPRWASQA